jgi:hypothetical protein
MTESRTSASAAGVRGLIIHLKGMGNLLSQSDFRSLLLQVQTYLIEHIYVDIPLVNSGLSSRVFPWSSTGGLISYTARTQDTIMYNALSLRCLPGHLLGKS